MIGGLIRPDDGSIVVDGRVLVDTATASFVPRHSAAIGYVFQDARLFPHLTCPPESALRTLVRAAQASATPTSASVVDLLGIGHLLDRRPSLLSGGEKQRVAIGRALLASPG